MKFGMVRLFLIYLKFREKLFFGTLGGICALIFGIAEYGYQERGRAPASVSTGAATEHHETESHSTQMPILD